MVWPTRSARHSIGAERAYGAGFVNVPAEPGEALAAARALADRICRNAPLSVQACLAAVNDELDELAVDGWERTNRAKAAILGSEDTAEGVRSFLEKRAPVWRAL